MKKSPGQIAALRPYKSPSRELPVAAIKGPPGPGRFLPCSPESGFTLLEVMAAIAILGIGIVMVIQLFSGGLGLAKASDDYTKKVLVAKEKMADTLLAEELEEGVTRGVTEDGVSWAVEISPYDLKKAGDGSNARIFKVVVSAEGPGARKNSFTLTTLKTVF